jgi:hypothetical protein
MTTTVKIDIENPIQLESVLAFISNLGLKAKISKNGKPKLADLSPDDYVFSSKANAERILKAFENIDNGIGLVEVDLVEFEKKYNL